MDDDDRTDRSSSPGGPGSLPGELKDAAAAVVALDLGFGCVVSENTAQDPNELNQFQLQTNLTMMAMNQVEDKVDNEDDKSGSIPGIARMLQCMSQMSLQAGGDVGGVVPENSTIEETDDDDTNKQNQLQTNPTIVDLIAKELPIDDLSTLRQSCKSWNQSFVSELAGRGGPIVELVPAEAARRLADLWRKPGHDTAGVKLLQDYTNLMRSSLLIPYSNYKIHQLHVEKLSRADFQEFFGVCGQSIKNLSLVCQWDQEEINVDRIREVIFELTPQVAKLSLTLHACRPKSTNTESEKKSNISVTPPSSLLNLQELTVIMPLSREALMPPHDGLVADLLKSAPRLECLSLKEVGPRLAVLKILSTLHNSISVLPNLNTLRLPNLRTQQIRVLAEDLGPRLRLQNLVMSVQQGSNEGSDQETADLLHQFLCTQASSLREFRLCVGLAGDTILGSFEGTAPFRIPRLDQLHTFGFRRKHLVVILVKYDGGTLAANFPRLKRYEYKFLANTDGIPPGFMFPQIDELEHIFHDGVTELELDVIQLDGNDEFDASFFAERLPSVRKLDFGFDSSIASPPFSIWTAWPELTSMRLRYEKVKNEGGQKLLEELLTGLPWILLENHDWIQVQRQLGTTEAAQEFRRFLQDRKSEPGLSDLKKLEDFKLVLTVEDKDDDGVLALSDFGGCLGLAMANPGLRRMEIHLQPKSSLDPSRFPSKWTKAVKELFTAECKEFIKSAFAPHASINIQIADSRYN